MVTLRNNHHSNLYLPDGTGVRRNSPPVKMAADKWADVAANPIVTSWVANGWLVVEGDVVAAPSPAPAPAPEPEPEEFSELESLRVDAAELGIAVDRRWGEKRLRDEIAKALAE